MLNKIIGLIFLWTLSQVSYAHTSSECTKIRIPVARLSCFDEEFKTPVYREKQNLQDQREKIVLPTVVREILNLRETEQERKQYDVQLFQSDDKVEIIMRSGNGNKFTPTLFIGCMDDITHFQVALKHPIKGDVFTVDIKDAETNKILFSETWQVLEKGYLLDIGRGLFAIDKLKRMLNTNKIAYEIPSLKYHWYFNTEGLKEKIKPLRKQCGW